MSTSATGPSWNVVLAERLWYDPELSIRAIAERVRISKNILSGHAIRHRDHFPERLKLLPGLAERVHIPNRKGVKASRGQPTVAAKPQVTPRLAPKPKPLPPAAPLQLRIDPDAKCCWPIGDPRSPEFRFCEAGPVVRHGYCEQHAKMAWVKVRPLEDVA